MSLFTSKTKSEIDKLIEENDELKNTLHIVLQKQQSLIELERKIGEARNELSGSIKLIETHKNELQSVVLDINSKKEKEKELTEKIKSLTEKKESLVSSISSHEDADKEFGAHREEYNTLNQNYNELFTELQKLNVEYLRTQQNLDVLRAEEEKLKNFKNQFGGNNIDESVAKMKVIESDLNERLNFLKNEESKRNASIKSLDEKITLSEDIKSSLETSLSAIVSELSEKEKMFTEFSFKRETMLDEIHRKQKEYDEFDAKYNLSKETIQKLEKETKEFSIKRDNLLAEIRKFEAVRNEIQDKILQLKREEESLTVSLSTRQQISEELEKKKLDFDESHLKIENNLALILQKFIEELNSSKDKLSSLRQQIIDKEKELNEK
jgi:chromosome segregation ATPase